MDEDISSHACRSTADRICTDVIHEIIKRLIIGKTTGNEAFFILFPLLNIDHLKEMIVSLV